MGVQSKKVGPASWYDLSSPSSFLLKGLCATWGFSCTADHQNQPPLHSPFNLSYQSPGECVINTVFLPSSSFFETFHISLQSWKRQTLPTTMSRSRRRQSTST